MSVRNRGLILITLSLLLAVVGFVLFKARRERAQVELADASALAPYRRDLPIGMTRQEVEAYFVSRKLDFSKDRSVDRVFLRQEKGDGIVCDRWIVYAAVDFDASNRLSNIGIQKTGHCL